MSEEMLARHDTQILEWVLKQTPSSGQQVPYGCRSIHLLNFGRRGCLTCAVPLHQIFMTSMPDGFAFSPPATEKRIRSSFDVLGISTIRDRKKEIWFWDEHLKNFRDDSEKSSKKYFKSFQKKIFLSSSVEFLFDELRNIYFEDVIAAAFKQIYIKLSRNFKVFLIWIWRLVLEAMAEVYTLRCIFVK